MVERHFRRVSTILLLGNSFAKGVNKTLTLLACTTPSRNRMAASDRNQERSLARVSNIGHAHGMFSLALARTEMVDLVVRCLYSIVECEALDKLSTMHLVEVPCGLQAYV